MKRKKLRVVAQRSCGGCSACCHVFAIQALDKPVQRDCVHLDRSRAEHHCTIYAERPSECQEYLCAWVREDGFGDDAHRPDKVGLLFTPRGNRREVTSFAGPFTLIAHETRPGALTDEVATEFLEHVASHFVVIVPHGPRLERYRLMGPERKVRAVVEWCRANGFDRPTGIFEGLDA